MVGPSQPVARTPSTARAPTSTLSYSFVRSRNARRERYKVRQARSRAGRRGRVVRGSSGGKGVSLPGEAGPDGDSGDPKEANAVIISSYCWTHTGRSYDGKLSAED